MIGSARAVKQVTFTIDGRELRAPEGSYVLGVAREAGIEIPTLCDDPALEPTGACRLCQVEVTHANWNGWKGLMTACLYPVSEGIDVRTSSPDVIEARRHVLTLLAARCPRSETIAALARKYDVSTEGLFVDGEADNCILCGLCTRVCETYVTSAITTYGRGTGKAIGAFAEEPPADCVGCGACAMICPTDHIPAGRTATGYRIWGREFETDVCVVDRTRCIGCGSCEEACPFKVARVVLHADGRRVATIPTEHCRGCGACVGACPSGAIDQEGFEAAQLLERMREARVSVMACPRTDLASRELGGGVELIEVPCTGRISSTLILDSIARGAEGVLVLGRHQETCRLDGAEDPARDRVERARAALSLAGIDPGRAAFELPAPGPEGPRRAVEVFAERIVTLGGPTVNESPPAELWSGEGLDTDLALLRWLSDRTEVPTAGAAWLEESELPAAAPGGAMLLPGVLPHVAVLADSLVAPLHVPTLLRSALAVLAELGAERVGVSIGPLGAPTSRHAAMFEGASKVYTLDEADARALRELGVKAVSLDSLLLESAASLPPPTIPAPIACDGSAEAVARIEALGHRPVDVGPDPLPDRFVFSPVERERAESRLVAGEKESALALLVSDTRALVSWSTITRKGTWRSSRVTPVLPHQLAFLSASGTPVTTRELEMPSLLRAGLAEVRS